VEDTWVDGWRGGLLLDSCSGPSSGCRRWLILIGVPVEDQQWHDIAQSPGSTEG
jgi:hypothetical protein